MGITSLNHYQFVAEEEERKSDCRTKRKNIFGLYVTSIITTKYDEMCKQQTFLNK